LYPRIYYNICILLLLRLPTVYTLQLYASCLITIAILRKGMCTTSPVSIILYIHHTRTGWTSNIIIYLHTCFYIGTVCISRRVCSLLALLLALLPTHHNCFIYYLFVHMGWFAKHAHPHFFRLITNSDF